MLNKLKEILFSTKEIYGSNRHLKIEKITDGYEITFGQQYAPPGLNFDQLMKISELFGTTKIDVDNYSQMGCETCDYGSNYGHTIQVKEPTLNCRAVEALIASNNNSI
jgi:hypothetical protein